MPPTPERKKPEDGPQGKAHGILVSSCCLQISRSIRELHAPEHKGQSSGPRGGAGHCHHLEAQKGLWGTTLTEDTAENRELYIKTTLRELLVYIVFLVDICL